MWPLDLKKTEAGGLAGNSNRSAWWAKHFRGTQPSSGICRVWLSSVSWRGTTGDIATCSCTWLTKCDQEASVWPASTPQHPGPDRPLAARSWTSGNLDYVQVWNFSHFSWNFSFNCLKFFPRLPTRKHRLKWGRKKTAEKPEEDSPDDGELSDTKVYQ